MHYKESERLKYHNEKLSEVLQEREGRAAEWNVILDPVTAAQLSYGFKHGEFNSLQEYLAFIAPKIFERCCDEEFMKEKYKGTGMDETKEHLKKIHENFMKFLKDL